MTMTASIYIYIYIIQAPHTIDMCDENDNTNKWQTP